MSLRKRIALFFVLADLVVFVVLFALLLFVFRRAELKSLELDLYLKGDQLEDTLESSPYEKWFGIMGSFPAQVLQLLVRRGQGYRVVYSKPPSLPPLLEGESTKGLSELREARLIDVNIDGIPYKAIVVKVSDSPERLLVVAHSLEGINRSVKHLLVIGAALFPMLGLLMFAVANLIIGASLSPVRRVIETARVITAEDLSKRIPEVKTGDEMEALVSTFNMMLSKLEESFSSLRQFTSSAAHELKTPLAVLKARVDVLMKDCPECSGGLAQLKQEISRLSRLVDGLLVLSRLEAPAGFSLKGKLHLDVVLLRVFEDYLVVADSKGVSMILRNVDPVVVEGDEELIAVALSNIVDNAVKYTPAGGRVEISLRREDSYAVLEIEDTGIGMKADEISRIFDPFFRGQNAHSLAPGVGLGLTVAKRILELHGARIEVEGREGGGTRFRVIFKALR